MLEKAQLIENKIKTLLSWIEEMKRLTENPYANGLNMERVLRDLEGFSNDLAKDAEALIDMAQPVELAEAKETEKAE